MKWVIIVLAALFLSVGIALMLRDDPGYVLLSMNDWTVETSVAFFVFTLLVLFGLAYLLLRFLLGLWRAPSWLAAAQRRYRFNRGHRLLTRGLEQLLEGHWKAAEKALVKGAPVSDTPMLHYISAAYAARRQGVRWQASNHLHKAGDLPDVDPLPAKLVQAEFLLEDDNAAEARDLLQPLRSHPGKHPRLLELLARSYQQVHDWKSLVALLPELGKSEVLAADRFRELQTAGHGGLMADAAQRGDLDELRAIWKQMPAALHQDETLLIDYAGHLRDLSAGAEAEALLRAAIERQWSDRLVVGYGEIGRGHLGAQLSTAEDWLLKHPDNAYLLLTCGRLARNSRQLDKARGYLERSIALQPGPDAYQELGGVLEELEQPAGALQCYREGLRLLSGRPETRQGAALAAGGTAMEPRLPGGRTTLPENLTAAQAVVPQGATGK